VLQRTRTAVLVEGDAGVAERFKYMSRDGATVPPGDLEVTTGLGPHFPKGLPVGRVTNIEDKGSALFHFAVLAPAVDFSRVEEVLLVTGQTTQDLAALFPSGGLRCCTCSGSSCPSVAASCTALWSRPRAWAGSRPTSPSS
jgi:hypothetical protein